MQTAAASQEQMAEGIQAGVFYYLTKPFKQHVLCSILENALDDYAALEKSRKQEKQTLGALQCIETCQFRIQTLEDVHHIAPFLANVYPKPESVFVGLKELMLNAIEHGNLGITYDEKTALNNQGRWKEEVERRLAQPEFQHKFAWVTLEKTPEGLSVTITDQGEGFDWHEYMEISPHRAMHNHGRGIAMANMMSFDEIHYTPPGNQVTCLKYLP